MVSLPTFIRESVILTDQEKVLLAQVSILPTVEEIDLIRSISFVQELLNAFIGDETTRDIHIQLKAKEYLNNSDVEMAWKILLL